MSAQTQSSIAEAARALIARRARLYPHRVAHEPAFPSGSFGSFDTASAQIRYVLDLDRLNKAQAAEVHEAVNRHTHRYQRRLLADPLAQRSPGRIRRLLQARLQRQVEDQVLGLYRQAEGRWAGGETGVHVSVGDTPSASGQGVRARSKNGKWRGLNAELRVTVSPSWRSRVLGVPGLVDAGGLLTTHAEQLAPDAWSASWVEQSRGFDLKVVSGVILRTEDGSFVHARTLPAARRVARQRADLEATYRRLAELEAAAFARRTARDRARAELVAMATNEMVDRYGTVTVTLADSKRAGNCESGTRSWVERHLPGRTEATVGELLAIDPDNSYVIRGCAAAILRSGALTTHQEASRV